MSRALLTAAMLAACSGDGATDDVASDYVLELRPNFIEGQSFASESPEIKLLVRTPDGATTLTPLGAGGSGERLEIPEQPPLDAGTVIGLLAESGGVPADQIDPDATIAYGQTTLTEALATGGQQVTLDLLMPRTTEVGLLRTLGNNKLRMFGALAVVPGGDAYLFGGNPPDLALQNGALPDKILKLADHDLGETTFVNLDTTLPMTEGTGQDLEAPQGTIVTEEFAGRTGLSATPVNVDGQPRILVAGGRQYFFTTDFDSSQAVLFDPATDTVDETLEMNEPRSEHLAIPFAEGRVLIIGGLDNGVIGPASYEIFDPERTRFIEGDNDGDLVLGDMASAGAPLGNFAMVCGGVTRVGGPNTWTVQDGCNIVRPTGEVEVATPLPEPRAGAAMAPLPDGGVLLTGGFIGDPADNTYVDPDPGLDFGEAPAVAGAWRYDPTGGDWIEVPDLNQARAHHAAIPLPSGDVLIVGGTEQGTGLYGDAGPAVRCPELYDTSEKTFSQLPCTDAGAGAYPAWGVADGEHIVVVAGFDATFNYDSTGAYGLMGVTPTL